MKPSEKSHGINVLLNSMFDREKKITENVCVFCGKSITPDSFKDECSLREYSISGLCQECQDEVFKSV